MSELLANVMLKKATGEQVKGSVALKGKVVGLYFSASWCMPCRLFTPLLKEFYEDLDGDFEVVFVSRDQSNEEMSEYMEKSHGNWYYISWDDPIVHALKRKCRIRGVPMLVIIRPNGDVITKDGYWDVQEKPPAKALADWKKTSYEQRIRNDFFSIV